jgi:hypothetical protein
MKARLALAVLTMLASPTLAQESVYTPTRGSVCRESGSQSAFNVWQCPGPAGFEVEFADEGNIVGVAVGRPDDKRKIGPPVSWRGAGRVFGDKLQWRLSNGIPVAVILRIWRVWTDRAGNDHTVQELLVMRLSSHGTCRVGAVDVRQTDANLIAQQLADTGTCMTS